MARRLTDLAAATLPLDKSEIILVQQAGVDKQATVLNVLDAGYSSSDFDTDFAAKDTDDLTESITNKYFFNHNNANHTATFLVAADVVYAVLDANGDIGTSAGQVAIGNHNHSGVYEPVFTKNTAFNKNFGTLAGTSSEGDHIHGAIYYTETELNAGQLDTRYYTETELNAGQLDTRYYTETELNAGQLDNRYYTETELTNGTVTVHYNNLTNVPSFIFATDVTYANLDINNVIGTGATQVSQGDHTHGAIYYTESEIDAAFLQVDGSNSMIGTLSVPALNINTVNPTDTATIFGTDSAGDSTMHIRIGNGVGDKFQIESWNGTSATSLLEITQADVNILGNLNVSGTTTTIDSSVLNVTDSDITLNSGQATAILNASVIVDRGTSTDAQILWNETSDTWQIDNGTGSASDIWSAGNDGTGSGLDADKLDGQEGSYYATTSNLMTGVDANRTTLTTTSDLNNLIISGFYRGNTLVNAPQGGWIYVLVQRHNATYVQQTAWNLTGTDTNMYIRHNNNGAWQAWAKMWSTRNDGSGSGLDADTLDSMNASSSNSSSTIVARDVSGHIYANFFNCDPDTQSSGVTKVLIETGNDGFIRHGNQAAIRDFIGAGTGNGLDADLLDGSHATTAATASTVAVRDGSADITARLFRSNYAETINEPAATADIAFRNESGTDNYIRFMSKAAMKRYLGTDSGSGTYETIVGGSVIIAHNLGTASFNVSITTTSNSAGFLGEVYVLFKTSTQFSVYKTGSASGVTFDWIVTET